MVFSSEYDQSLWLMICGDSFNREKISFVIKNIPFEFLKQIQENIREYTVDGIRRNINYERDNLRYEVSISDTELSIKMISKNNEEIEEIDLFILPVDEKKISKMKWNSSISLGGLITTTDYYCLKLGTVMDEFELVRTFFGNVIKLYADNNVGCLSKKRVVVKRMPDSFTIHQIRTDKSIKKLVRGKK